MTIRNAISAVVIPPMGLAYVALICTAGALLLRRHRRTVPVAAAVVALLAMLGLAMPAVGTVLLNSLENGLPKAPSADRPPQAIVILSAEADRTEKGIQPGSLTLQRLLAGARLWRRTGLPILVSGGVFSEGDPAIAQVMAETLRDDFRVPVKWQEDRSETTWQNAADTAAILLPEGIRSVYVVTHAWHERRAAIAFRHFGFEVTAAPFPAEAASWNVLPDIGGFASTYYALHEWLGIAAYAARAWLAGPARAPARTVSNKSA
jgi:uncharacterized SAM-binding protein YcdF (DUF218 family)